MRMCARTAAGVVVAVGLVTTLAITKVLTPGTLSLMGLGGILVVHRRR